MSVATLRPEDDGQAAVLRRLRDGGPATLAALAAAAGLSRARAAAAVDRLVALGLLGAPGPGPRGPVLLDLSPDLRFLGVVVGARAVDMVVTDARAQVLGCASRAVDARRQGPEAVVDVVEGLAGTLRHGGGPPRGAGVGLPGPVVLRGPGQQGEGRGPGWEGFPLRLALAQQLGCPVRLDTEAALMAVGETRAGVARTVPDLLLVTVGADVGCGIVIDGAVYRGAGGTAGDIGHVHVADDGPPCPCGRNGCLAAWVSLPALEDGARRLAGPGGSRVLADRLAATGTVTLADLAEAARREAAAADLVRAAGRRLGQHLAGLVSFCNPAMVVLGGEVPVALGHPLLDEVRSMVLRRSPRLATVSLPVVLSELGRWAGPVGAARVAADQAFAPA